MSRSLVIPTVAVLLAVGGFAALGGPSSVGAGKFRTVTQSKDYAIAVDCLATSGDGYCHPVHWVPVQVGGKLSVVFTASAAHCGAILVRMGYDNGFSGPNYAVAPGSAAGGPYSGISRGLHVVGVIAKASGDAACPAGALRAYEGTLTVETTKRVRR
jgi:hypothetical protein